MNEKSNAERTDVDGVSQVSAKCWTVGHSTLPAERFLARLDAHSIEQVADVRRYPASRRHPQFNRETLATFLDARGKKYRWFENLGGRRGGVPAEESLNRGLANDDFRHYADYMLTAEFDSAFAALVAWLSEGRTALMCAEVLWWRCHRRLLSDRLVAAGGEVVHIMDDEKVQSHPLWDLATPAGSGLIYPPDQGELGL